jgi:hypothetical protein
MIESSPSCLVMVFLVCRLLVSILSVLSAEPYSKPSQQSSTSKAAETVHEISSSSAMTEEHESPTV